MDFKFATKLNIATYLTSLGVGTIILLLLNGSLSKEVLISPGSIFLSMLLANIFTTLGSVYYFQKLPCGRFKEGLWFGIIAILVAFILDGVLGLLIILTGNNPADLFGVAYTHWYFGTMLLLTPVLSSFVSKYTRRPTINA